MWICPILVSLDAIMWCPCRPNRLTITSHPISNVVVASHKILNQYWKQTKACFKLINKTCSACQLGLYLQWRLLCPWVSQKREKKNVIAHIRLQWPFSLHHLMSTDGCCHAPQFIHLITNIISFTQIVHWCKHSID